jgi:aminoglycoside phosphotransferase (APT) family kinase protein
MASNLEMKWRNPAPGLQPMTTLAQRRLALRQRVVARQLVDVGASLHAFDHGPDIPFEGRKQYLSRTVDEAMKEAERAFSDEDYDKAEYLAKVVAYLVKREAPKFAANPKAWIEKHHAMKAGELQ